MPPKRQPAKRKATARGGDQHSDYSDTILTVANKKAKRSERKPTRRSPRLHSDDEGKLAKVARTGRRSRHGEANNEDELSDEDDGGLELLNQAALQRKASQKEVQKSKMFLVGFRKKQKTEEEELAEFSRGKMDNIEIFSKGFSEQFGTSYSEFMKKGSQPPQRQGNLEAQPLYEEGRQTLSLCQEVLRHYKSANALGKGEELNRDTRSIGQDKRDILEIIGKGKQFGEKVAIAAVSPSAGNGSLAPAQPASTTDELVAGFYEASLAKIGEGSRSKSTWGLWMALDKVVKLLQEETA